MRMPRPKRAKPSPSLVWTALGFLLLLPGTRNLARAQATNPVFPNSFKAQPWPKADRLFRTGPRWLGGDDAYSIDLGNGRVLWLFGDSFIAKKPGDSRQNSVMVRNSVAIQKGYDPARAKMTFYWGERDGHPFDFAPGEGKLWLWPNQGIRLGSHLLLFYSRVAPDKRKDSLGFQSAGWTAFLVDNLDRQPSEWKLHKLAVPEGRGNIIFGMSVLRMSRFVYAFGHSEPEHDVYLIRWPLAEAARGDLSSPEWWCGDAWSANPALRRPLLRDVSSEFSVQRDPHGRGFIEVNSQGFGASIIVARFAPRLEGPWSKARGIYRPPESNRPDAFVYGGKSHPGLTGADVVITYVANSSSFGTLVKDTSIYFPRFVRLDLH